MSGMTETLTFARDARKASEKESQSLGLFYVAVVTEMVGALPGTSLDDSRKEIAARLKLEIREQLGRTTWVKLSKDGDLSVYPKAKAEALAKKGNAPEEWLEGFQLGRYVESRITYARTIAEAVATDETFAQSWEAWVKLLQETVAKRGTRILRGPSASELYSLAKKALKDEPSKEEKDSSEESEETEGNSGNPETPFTRDVAVERFTNILRECVEAGFVTEEQAVAEIAHLAEVVGATVTA